MRVIHVIPGLGARQGGPAQATVHASLALRDLGIECTIVATDLAEAASSATYSRVTSAELPAGADELDVRLTPVRWPGRYAFSPELARVLDRELPTADVVHIHGLYLYPSQAAFRLASHHRKPFVVAPCGMLDPALRHRNRPLKAVVDTLWQRRMLDSAAAIHYKTRDEARLVSDLRLRAPARVVPNGIDFDGFAQPVGAEEFRARHLPDPGAPIVLNLGRLSYKKNLEALVRALPAIRREVPRTCLVLAGPDDEGLTPALRALAEAEGVADAVVFTGMLRGAERLAALAATDVWALPSHTENFGTAVVEALAAGLPTVISPGVNLAGEIAAAHAGIVAQPADFATTIATLLRDRVERAQLGDRARRFARRYDWSAVAPQLADLYRSIATATPFAEAS